MNCNTNGCVNSTIHVALSPGHLDENYNQHAAVSMVSILEHTKRKVIFHILYLSSESDDEKVCELTQKRYHKLCSHYCADVVYHKITPPKYIDLPEYSNIHKYTYNAISRIHLPELLPNLSRVIYIDCDMVITTDLGKLWDLDLNGSPIAAHYVGKELGRRICDNKIRKKFQLDWNDYINSGILIFNIPVINDLDFNLLEKAHYLLKKYPKIPFPDQDVLNIIFKGMIFFLDDKYNVSYDSLVTTGDTSIDRDLFTDKIIHYVGFSKPWNTNLGEVGEIYWYYFSKTPWCESEYTLIKSLQLLFPNPKKYLTTEVKFELNKIPFITLFLRVCSLNIAMFKDGIKRVAKYLKSRILW